MTTPPPWSAGSIITADALNMLVPQIAVLGTDTLIATETATSILAVTGIGVGTWHVTGKVYYTAADSSGAVDISIHAVGTGAISDMFVAVSECDLSGSAVSVYAGEFLALGGVFTSQTMTSGASYMFDIDGIMVVSTGGGFSVDVAETAAHNFTVQALSYVRFEPVLS